MEAEKKLATIAEMIDEVFNRGTPMLNTTQKLLEQLQIVALGIDEEETETKERKLNKIDHVIISCDASIKVNPGGPSSVGIVLQIPNEKPLELAQMVPARTNNQAEADAIYFALTSLMNLKNNPGCEVEVRSDSKLVVDMLNGDCKCHDEKLKKRIELIRELVESLPVPVRFEWRPRNSTPELEMANYLAQDLLDVPRH